MYNSLVYEFLHCMFFSIGWGATTWESTGIYWASKQIWQWKNWSYGEVSKISVLFSIAVKQEILHWKYPCFSVWIISWTAMKCWTTEHTNSLLRLGYRQWTADFLQSVTKLLPHSTVLLVLPSASTRVHVNNWEIQAYIQDSSISHCFQGIRVYCLEFYIEWMNVNI